MRALIGQIIKFTLIIFIDDRKDTVLGICEHILKEEDFTKGEIGYFNFDLIKPTS